MKTHTSSFKEQIKLIGKEIDSRITFGDTVLGKDDLNAVTPSYQGAILKSVMKQLDIDSNVAIPIGTILKYEFGLKVNGEYEYINYGNYVVYSIEKQEDTNSYKIVCYDKLLYSMLDYVKLPITYPISVRDYINAISTALGLTFANNSGTFANYDKQIQADLYDGLGYTFRDVLDELAQVTASTICLNNNDELEIRYITETGDTIDEEFLKDVNVNFGEKFGAVNTIVLSRSGDSDSVYYPEVLPTNPYEIKISDNQIMNGNDRADFLPDIYNKLNGLKFYTNDFVSTGIVYYDLCDRYSVKVGDNTYSCVMFNDEVLVTQGLEENIYTELPEQTETDYKKADTTDRRINQAYAILDKQNKEFEVLVSEVNSNEEKIASLEITTGNISTKVSSVETDLNTTKTNLSNLSGTVDTLNDNINGVSADFEDFKDNEYIQSIDNLQKQIDGAIQFWNGAEIPTLNNYPANEWTTENDKINHQADIYTVVQDIEGEMKQGKSYRFDKIDGVWQWIELTDNELSAVQAIAQEALNKANANKNEIGTIKTNVSELQQTDEQIKASVESIDKQIIPTASVSDSNIYVEDASDDPLIQFEIEGKSEQETTNGNQLIDFANPDGISTYTTSTFENDILTVSSTDGTYQRVRWDILNILKNNAGKTLYFDYESVDFSSGKSPVIQIYVTENSAITYHSVNKTSYAIPDDVSNITDAQIGIYPNNSATSGAYSISITKPMLQFGTDELEYESFTGRVASPNPDYPSKIESVGYENLYDEKTYPIIEKASYNSAGEEKTWSNNYGIREYMPVKENKIYTYSNDIHHISLTVIFYNIDKIFLSSFAFNTNNTFTTPDDCKYIRFSIESTVAPTKIQIEEGSIAHSYIPYGKYGVEVKTIGKNKIDKNSILSGNRLGSNGLPFAENGYWLSEYIKVKSSSNYVYSRKSGNGSQAYAFYDENQNFISRSFMTPSETIYITTDTNTKYIRITDLNASLDVSQLEEGSVATEYQPYQESASVMVLNAPLRNLSNGVKDIAYIKNNRLYVDRYVGSVVLDGTQTSVYTDTSIGRYDYTIPNAKLKGLCLSTHFSYKLAVEDGKIFLSSVSEDRVSIVNASKKTLTDMNSWLSIHKPQVDYELAEPYTEEIGSLEMPSTFKDVNHISTTDNLEPTINIEYVRDTTLSNYVENQINKVMTIEERHYSELVIEDNSIKESVESVNSSVDGLNTTINRVEEITTDNSQVINVISTNIDKTTGEVREVTTTTGFTFNANGMTIDDGSGFKGQHTAQGTFYKDGDTITGQYTKDNSKQKDLYLFGSYYYGMENINDTPMFIGQLYNDENGEECFGHFYNGGGY